VSEAFYPLIVGHVAVLVGLLVKDYLDRRRARETQAVVVGAAVVVKAAVTGPTESPGTEVNKATEKMEEMIRKLYGK